MAKNFKHVRTGEAASRAQWVHVHPSISSNKGISTRPDEALSKALYLESQKKIVFIKRYDRFLG